MSRTSPGLHIDPFRADQEAALDQDIDSRHGR